MLPSDEGVEKERSEDDGDLRILQGIEGHGSGRDQRRTFVSSSPGQVPSSYLGLSMLECGHV